MRKILCLLYTLLLFSISAQAKDLRFIQISDLKFSGKEENNKLQNIIEDINKQKDVKFVVFTGDNIAKPSTDLLKEFIKEAEKLKYPFYIVLGDKDVNKQKHLGKKEYMKILKKNIRKYKPESPNYIFEQDGLVFALVDGSKEVIPGTNGYYKEDVLNWLDNELAAYPDNHVIIFQHFPIIPPVEKESYYTFKPEKYIEVLAKYKNVIAIIAGHFDVNSEKNVYGIKHITTASSHYRIIDVLDYDTQTPIIWAQLKQVE